LAIFDEIQKRLRDQKAAAPAVSQQAVATDVLRAKTGRATPGGAPAMSTVGQNVATNQVAQQAVTQQAQATQAAEQLAAANTQAKDAAALAQEKLDTQRAQADADRAAKLTEATGARGAARQGFDLQAQTRERMQTQKVNSAFDQAVRQLESDKGIARDDLFASFKQGKGDLDMRKDAAELEQLAFKLQMSDRAYVDTIQRIGSERRLGDEINWNRETSRLVFGEKEALLRDAYGFQSLLDVDNRKFNEAMTKMDSDLAMKLAMSAIKDASQAQVAKGVVGAVEKGTDAYLKNPDAFKSKDDGIVPTEGTSKTLPSNNTAPGSVVG
jgi:hypothetical protein